MKDILLLYSAALEDAWWMLQALRESRHAIYSEASNQLVACVPLLPSKCPSSVRSCHRTATPSKHPAA
jgi:hypothetical protein